MEYSEACSDIWYLLKTLKQEEIKKIPAKLIETIRILKSDEYVPNIDLNIPLENQNLSDASIGLISFIYNNYLGTEEEKDEYGRIYDEYLNNNKKNNNNMDYSFKFKNKETDNNYKIKNEIVEYHNKTNIFLRFLNKIKKVFIK